MMNAQKDFFSYLAASPQEISARDIPVLEALCQQYPYFALAHSFLAKVQLQEKNNDFATDAIRRAAAYSANRSALRKLVTNDFQANEKLPIRNRLKGLKPLFATFAVEESAKEETLPIVSKSPTTIVKKAPIEVKTVQALRAADYAETLLSNEIQLQESKKSVIETQQQQSDIIEKFIKSEPRIRPLRSKPTNEDIPIEDLAERSAPSQSILLVTESFAKIMESQGRYDKAADIYDKLSAKFPDKKMFFAQKSETLRRKMAR